MAKFTAKNTSIPAFNLFDDSIYSRNSVGSGSSESDSLQPESTKTPSISIGKISQQESCQIPQIMISTNQNSINLSIDNQIDLNHLDPHLLKISKPISVIPAPIPPEYEMGPVIKKTANSIIQEAQLTSDSPIVVIKRLDLNKCQAIDLVTKEIHIMGTIRHPNLLPYHHCFIKDHEVYIVMDKFDISLDDLAKPNGLHDYQLVSNIFYYILSGLEYLHDHNIIHRDMKGANVLLNRQGQVVLADFGVSKQYFDGYFNSFKPKASSFVGTPCWMSPEMCEKESYDYKTDIWSLGITLLETYFGYPPYAKYPPMKVFLLILRNPPPVPAKADLAGRNNLHNFVTLCLQREPEKRPTATKLLSHRYIKTNKKSTSYLVDKLDQLLIPKIAGKFRTM